VKLRHLDHVAAHRNSPVEVERVREHGGTRSPAVLRIVSHFDGGDAVSERRECATSPGFSVSHFHLQSFLPV